MADLRLFSYLPNPRIWKAVITARLCDVDVEVRGAKPQELANWLWDYDARPLSDADRASPDFKQIGKTGFSGDLYKTPSFLEAHPFGTVPAAFGNDGDVGVFESNSIMRAAARLRTDHRLYGEDAMSASRIDGFLDVSLVFARASQTYLLALNRTLTKEIHQDAMQSFDTYLSGMENALSASPFLAADYLTLADICFACELCLLYQEHYNLTRLKEHDLQPLWSRLQDHPKCRDHFDKLRTHEAFAPEMGPYIAKIDAKLKVA